MNYILLILSVLIYASFGIPNCIYILFSLLTSYFAAKYLKNKYGKYVLGITIALNTLVLLFVKFTLYTGANINIFAPIGISYYTLQVISYLVDVYKGKYDYEKNFITYALYIMYIPHLFIGPITRYDDMKKELSKKRKFTLDNLYNGGLRILWGLAKKLIIAGRISILISTITSNTDIYRGMYAFIAMILYSIQLYTDFSGGIDIVLGASKILGINLAENFNAPYFAENVKEFWRRWHISLSTWLKDYIYIPLGGSRCGKIRKIINVLVTFFVSGIWHGLNYILWGIMQGIFVLFGDKYKTKFKWFNRLLNFVIISFLWSFFIWNNNLVSLKMMGSVFTTFNISDVCKNILNLGIGLSDWIVLIISTILLFIFDGNAEKIINKIKSISKEKRLIIICTMALIILVFGIYGIGFNVNEFIYSKF